VNDHDEQRPDPFDQDPDAGTDHGAPMTESAVATENGARNGNGQIEDFLRTASAPEREGFFASFDQMLQENMARSRDLLQQAMTLPTVVEREVANVRAEAETRLAEANAAAAAQLGAERDRSRFALTALQNALNASRQQAEQAAQGLGALIATVTALSERVAATLADLDVAVADPTVADQPMVEPVASAPEATAQDAAPVAVDGAWPAMDEPAGEVSDVAEPAAADASDALEFAPEAAPVAASGDGGEATAEPVAEAGRPEDADGAMTIVVHGVHHAISVLSFKRHLARLRHVESVAVKEYADGVLNLQVTARKPLTPKDLQSWEGGAGLEITNIAADTIEAHLPEVAKV